MKGETSKQLALRDPDVRLMLRVRDDDNAVQGRSPGSPHEKGGRQLEGEAGAPSLHVPCLCKPDSPGHDCHGHPAS